MGYGVTVYRWAAILLSLADSVEFSADSRSTSLPDPLETDNLGVLDHQSAKSLKKQWYQIAAVSPSFRAALLCSSPLRYGLPAPLQGWVLL
jgi:hypothetical protein